MHVSKRRSRETPLSSNDLLSLPDVGQVTVGWLKAVGIANVSALRRVGAVEAFGRIAFRFGSAANRNLLYALAMGLQGRKYNSATEPEKRQLCEEAGIEFRPRARSRNRRR